MERLALMPKYEAYKDSGVEWLGDIPSSWELKPGFVAFSENKRSNKGMKENTVLSLSYGNIVVKPEEKLVGLVPESFETYQLVEPDDIIVRCTDLQNDKVSLRTGLAKNKGIITSAYLNLRVKNGFDARFLHYYLHALDTTKVLYKFGSGLRQNLSFLDFKRLPIFEIPEDTQKLIANYLEKKTAQVDDAIAIKEQQISLLKERKQIIIQQAVTQGLDPNVPMKDSGVDWIGKIPAHWELPKLKLTSEFILDGTHGSYPRVEDGYRLLSVRNIVDNEFVFREDDSRVSYRHFLEISSKFEVSEGDIQLAIVGATLGKVAIVGYLTEKIVTQRSVSTIRVRKSKAINKFVASFMRSESFQSYLWSNAGFSAQPGVYLNTIQNAYVPLPSLNEQEEIVRFIEEKLLGLDESITLAQQQIEKLKEYKTTLINSTVTGKIKVTPEMVEQ